MQRPPVSTDRAPLRGAAFAVFLLHAFGLAAALWRLVDHAFGPFDGGVHVSDVPADAGVPLALALALAYAVTMAAVYVRVRWAWLSCAALAVVVVALAVAEGTVPLLSPIVLVLSLRPSVRQGLLR